MSRKIRILVSFLAGLWCISIVAAPALRSLGSPVAPVLYSVFSEVCHQFPDRSFHLEGEPFAVCMRCSSIYFSVLASLFAVPFISRFRFKQYPPVWILAAAVAPMVLDVVLNLTGLHSSTVWTRTLTGVTVGFVVPFFLMPSLIEAVHQLFEKFGGLNHAGKTQ